MDMDKYYPYNSVGGDRLHDADDLARILKALITTGVAMKSATALQVLAVGDFNVTVKAGTCVIEGRIGVNGSDKSMTIAAPYAGADRIDRIVVRAGYSNRKTILLYIQGSPGSTPVAPALKNDSDGFDISLARIAVSRTAASLSQAVIIDERPVSGMVVPSNIEAWIAQVVGALNDYKDQQQSSFSGWRTARQADFTTWFATIQNTLGADVAGNLLNLITQYRARAATATLLASGWTFSGTVYTQTLSVAIVPANCVLHGGALEASRKVYTEADVHISAASAGSVTFTAASLPTVDLTVSLSVSEVSA